VPLDRIALQIRPPYDPDLSLRVWLRHPLEQVDCVEDGVFRRLFFRDGRPVLLALAPGGTVEKPVCAVSLSGDFTADDLSWALDLARWIINDDAPLQAFHDHIAGADQALSALAARLRGLRPHRSPALFDTLVFAILGQQVNLNFTYICRSALEAKYARRATIDGREWIAGIEPEDLAGAGIEDLRAMKISRSKARAILELADAFRSVPMDRETLALFDAEEIIVMLTSLRGIGPWTAEYACLRGLGLPDILPAGDVALQKAIGLIHKRDKPTAREVRDIGERWRPFRSLATYYLWTSLSLGYL
jgi:DNA-3-methyladenine glycosylase II